MRTLLLAVVVLLTAGSRHVVSAAYIVRNGQPEAQIVVDVAPPRTTRLAAQQLQYYLEKISGAVVPITADPSGDIPAWIFVGRSAHTDRFGIEPYGVKDGGYRMVSGGNWLALIGRDDDFVPIEPWPRNHGHWISGDVHEQWDAITGAQWGHPLAGFHKRYSGRAWAFDPAVSPWTNTTEQVDFWAFDERGSFNAVCDFLRRLGVRWYMPGELGEVVPRRSSIALPEIDETVRPDFSLRRVNWGAGFSDRDVALWDGDAVELFFETDVHSYYQIAVNPAGAVADVDRAGSGDGQLDWDAQVEVATEVGEGFWAVEIRIPVADDTNDPLHNVAGRKPTESLPWYFNLCRQRVRSRGTERSAFSPTSSGDVQVPRRFGKLYVR